MFTGTSGPNLVRERIATLQGASCSLREIAAAPIPRGLGARHAREATEYLEWLQRASEEMEELAERYQHSLGTLPSATRETGQAIQNLNRQYLQLQQGLGEQHRLFSFTSNIRKARHDTLKSIIDNLR